MRISDWSSDVCSSDLRAIALYREYVDSAPGAEILVPMLDRAQQGGESPVEVQSATDGMAEVLFNLAGLLSQEQADDAALIHLHQALVLTPDFVLRSEEHTSELQSLMRISYAVFCLE